MSPNKVLGYVVGVIVIVLLVIWLIVASRPKETSDGGLLPTVTASPSPSVPITPCDPLKDCKG